MPRWCVVWTASRPIFWLWRRPGPERPPFALVAARMVLAEQPTRVVVVTPTAHLKT